MVTLLLRVPLALDDEDKRRGVVLNVAGRDPQPDRGSGYLIARGGLGSAHRTVRGQDFFNREKLGGACKL